MGPVGPAGSGPVTSDDVEHLIDAGTIFGQHAKEEAHRIFGGSFKAFYPIPAGKEEVQSKSQTESRSLRQGTTRIFEVE